MSILATYIVPHPPLILPGIGRGEEKKIQNTIDSMRKIAADISEIKPDTIVVLSPHSVMYADHLHISPGKTASGDMSQFRAPDIELDVSYDTEFAGELEVKSTENGISAGIQGEIEPKLDHATMIPLIFINEKYTDYETLRIAPGGMSYDELYRFGSVIRQVADGSDKKIVIVASGDLSHKLKDEGPYGFAKEGPEFDAQICKAIETGDFSILMDIDPELEEKAADCGLRAFIIMAGALDKTAVHSELLSYEGPFGVGYAVGRFLPEYPDDNRDFLKIYNDNINKKTEELRNTEGEYVRLARNTVEELAKNHREYKPGHELPESMTNQKAGVFVSIKKDGMLRGCIGTIGPVTENVGTEIIRNAISASSEDPRFPAITEDELDHLSYSVDVLMPPEDISDRSMLDTKKYGVIVNLGYKRGLLLPNLEGIDDVDDQIDIAMQKAGISPADEGRVSLQRFEVIRHY